MNARVYPIEGVQVAITGRQKAKRHNWNTWDMPCALVICTLSLVAWWSTVYGKALQYSRSIRWCIDAPLAKMEERYLCLLEMALTGSLADEAGRCDGGKGGCELSRTLPYNSTMRYFGNDWPPLGHTMVGHARLQNIKHAIETCNADGIVGDFAELGVWRGGASIYAKGVITAYGARNRRVLVLDAFESLPQYGNHKTFLETSEVQVKHNFQKYGLLDSNVIFIRGLFRDSLPRFKRRHPGVKIAVLRIDSNFYDSYQDALYYLYELVPVGGFVIFDDVMSHPAVMQCWKDFKNEQGLPEELEQIDDHSAFFRKTMEVKVNFSYFKAPQDANLDKGYL